MPEPVDSAKHALLIMMGEKGVPAVASSGEIADRIVAQLLLDKLMTGDIQDVLDAKQAVQAELDNDRSAWESPGDIARHAIAALYKAGYRLA